MKKTLLIVLVSLFTKGLIAQGIIGYVHSKAAMKDGNTCSQDHICSVSGYRIEGMGNRSVDAVKGQIKGDLMKANYGCDEVAYREFAKGDVVAIYIISFKDGSCKWSNFIFGKGKNEAEAFADMEKQANARPEKDKTTDRIQMMTF